MKLPITDIRFKPKDRSYGYLYTVSI